MFQLKTSLLPTPLHVLLQLSPYPYLFWQKNKEIMVNSLKAKMSSQKDLTIETNQTKFQFDQNCFNVWYLTGIMSFPQYLCIVYFLRT